MISIAICDDDLVMSKKIERAVKNIYLRNRQLCDVSVFSTGSFLVYEIEDGGSFDLLLLDIEMPGVDGISLAERIKDCLPHCLIIFITSYDKYVYDSFKVQPFRFIPKESLNERLPEALRDAMIWIEKNVCRFYQIQNQQGVEKIPIGEITYIWHREKYAYVEKVNGECSKVRKTLKQVYEELPSGDFVWIDKGCICNLSHIMKIKGGDVTLVNGIRLAVSRDRLTELKDKMLSYWMDIEER